MSLFSRFISSSSPDVLLAGDHSTFSRKKTFGYLVLYEKTSVFLLLVFFVVSFSFFSSFRSEKNTLQKEYFEFFQKVQVEKTTLGFREEFLSRRDEIARDQELFSAVLPDSSKPASMLIWLEYLFEQLREEFFVFSPELISWRKLSDAEIPSESYAGIAVTEFSFPFQGDYRGFIQLLSLLRSSQRFIDLRSFRNLSYQEDGLVSVDLMLWAYNLSTEREFQISNF